jgi:hypothetical protein
MSTKDELNSIKKRDTEVLLYGRLRKAIKKINPTGYARNVMMAE